MCEGKVGGFLLQRTTIMQTTLNSYIIVGFIIRTLENSVKYILILKRS